MLTEAEVIDLLSNYLIKKGFKCKPASKILKKEYDLVAENRQHVFFVVTKASTSSRRNPNHARRAFNKSQIENNIGKALIALLKIIDAKPEGKGTQVAFAFSDIPFYNRVIEKIFFPLNKLGIVFFRVSEKSVIELGRL
jgi:hypothetical protein